MHAANAQHAKSGVLYFVEAFGGGVLEWLRCTANSLAQASIPVAIIHGRRPETPVNPGELFHPTVDLLSVPGWGNRSNVIRVLSSNIAAYLLLRNEIASRNPEVVHLHSTVAGVVGRLLPPLTSDLFYTPHAFAFLNPRTARPLRRCARALERIQSRRPIYCCVSRHEASIAASLGAREVVLVHNGIALPPLETGRLQKARSRPVVACIGRASLQRHADTVADLARQARTTLYFKWIGGGTESRRLRDAGVEVTGWLPRERAIQHLQEADIVLHLARFEGLPFALLEAMGSGLPIVASDISVLQEVVGDSAVLVRDVEETLSALHALAGDSARCVTLGCAARIRYLKEYTEEAMVRRMKDLYFGVDAFA